MIDETKKYMKINELSILSGVSVPRIRYLIARRIVPEPIKANKTSAYYTAQHLERLKLIKKMLDEKNLSVAAIKEIIDSVNQIEGSKEIEHPNGSEIVRNKIIDSSIPIFRKKGYERATITDIAKAAAVSRSSIYQYFKGKKELFIDSLNRIFFEWRKGAPNHNDQTDAGVVLKKGFVSAYNAYPTWSDMMNLLRVSAAKDPAAFSDKLEDSLNIRIKAIADDIEKGIRQGVFREVNVELVSIMLAGVSEYLCYYLHRGKLGREPSEIGEEAIELFFRGLKRY